MNYLSRMSFVAAVMLFAAEGFAAPQQERTTPKMFSRICNHCVRHQARC